MRRPRRREVERATPAEWAYLRDLACPPDADPFEWLQLEYANGPAERAARRALWERYRAEVLAEWIAASPGTRPRLWWLYDAPAWPEAIKPPALKGSAAARGICWPRRRMGGTGTPAHECLAYTPQFEKGVPARWITAEDLETWPDLRDRDGRPAVAYDPEDPPVFESEQDYIDRHGFITLAERQALCHSRWPHRFVVQLPADESAPDPAA